MTHKVTQDDINAAARGIGMVRMDGDELRDLIRLHHGDLFADKVITAAAKQMLAAKRRVGLIKNPRGRISGILADHAKSIGKRAVKHVGRKLHAAASRKLSSLHARYLANPGARRIPAGGHFYNGSWEHDRDDVLGIAQMIAERDPNFPGVQEVLAKYGKRAKKTITAKFALYVRKGTRGQWKQHGNYATESVAREDARALAAKGYTVRCEKI